MKANKHPEEVALEIVMEGIECGYMAEDIVKLIAETLDVNEEVPKAMIQRFLSKKLFYKEVVKDEMMGAVLFYTLTKPKPPTIKKVGTALIPLGYMTGADIRACTGISTFSRSRPKNLYTEARDYTRRTVPVNSTLGAKLLKRSEKKMEPEMVRTRWPEPKMERTREPEMKRTTPRRV